MANTPFKMKGSPLAKKKVTVEKVGDGSTRKTITRTRRDGTIKKVKTILSEPNTKGVKATKYIKKKKKKRGTAAVTVQKHDKQGNKLRKNVIVSEDVVKNGRTVRVRRNKTMEVNDYDVHFRKTRKSDTKARGKNKDK